MRAYVQYYEKKLDGVVDEALGSDGYSPLDGRFSLPKMIAEAKTKTRNFREYDLFEIRRGDFKTYRVLYTNIKEKR